MRVTPEDLAERYRALQDADLIKLHRSGDLTEVATRVLAQEVERRGLDLASLADPRVVRLEFDRDCPFCGQRHSRVVELKAIGGHSLSGLALNDLDGRLGGGSPEAALLAVTRCPQCGYCSAFDSDLPRNARATLESEGYRRACAVTGPELAREWHCWSFLCEQGGDRQTAAVAAQNAAWACDDVDAEEASRFFRLEALRHYAAAPEGSGAESDLADEKDSARGSRALTIIDLERRVGLFDRAVAHVIELEPWASRVEHRRAAAFELHLIGRGDQGRYSYRDAARYAASKHRGPSESEGAAPAKRWWQVWR